MKAGLETMNDYMEFARRLRNRSRIWIQAYRDLLSDLANIA